MKVKVYIEDFNPTSKCWNRTGVYNLEDFDLNMTFPSKYGGTVRIVFEDENGKRLSLEEATKPKVVKEVVVKEETVKKSKVGRKTTSWIPLEEEDNKISLTDEKADDSMEKEEW